jgi:hypothetical protein
MFTSALKRRKVSEKPIVRSPSLPPISIAVEKPPSPAKHAIFGQEEAKRAPDAMTQHLLIKPDVRVKNDGELH